MILIDAYAESKLAETLVSLRADPKTARCIYFHAMNAAITDDFKEVLFALTQRYLPSLEVKIYLCEDGDIYILAPAIPTKDGKALILSVGEYLSRPITDDWVGFYEVSLHIHKLMLAVDAKLDRIHQREEEKRKRLEQEQHERKRQAILNGGVDSKAEEIKHRRTSRIKPELMMIEDDMFSRRLVENVLQKQYSLTGLGEATHALDTYAKIAPDLLFLDIDLPDVTGHELLEKILKMDPDAHVIMLSGNCDRENITQAMSKGAKGFIAKPFTKKKLLDYIDDCPTITV